MMKQGPIPTQQQRAVLLPQLSATMLRLPHLELATVLSAAAEQNPFLDLPSARIPVLPPHGPTLRTHLFGQLMAMPLASGVREDALACAGEVDEAGFLVPDEVLAAALIMGRPRLARATALVRSLEPTGVGARDLRECLLLQLTALFSRSPAAEKIVREHFPALARRRLDLIPQPGQKQALTLLASLTPRPGDLFASTASDAEAEIAVTKRQNLWRVSLVADPTVTLHPDAAKLAAAGKSWRGLRAEANLLIKALSFRRRSLLAVAQALVDRQRGFLEHGPSALVPLGLTDIAAACGLAVSTVAAITSGKMMLAPGGIVSLKSLLPRRTAGTEKSSGAALRAAIKKLVAAEDPNRPLSDAALARRLVQQGFAPARRTVAKHRSRAGYAPASGRRNH